MQPFLISKTEKEKLKLYLPNIEELLNAGNIDEIQIAMPTYDNTIYRGMHFANGDKKWQEFADKKVGDTLKMKSISSWSSSSGVAQRYAADNNKYEDSVILTCDKNLYGVACQNISKFGTTEAEVLCPSFSSWVVVSKSIVNKYVYLKERYESIIKTTKNVFKKNLAIADLKDLEEGKERYLKSRVCKLEVKEL